MKTNNTSETLRRLLFNKKMKVVDLARATQVPQPTVQRIVAGDCSRPHLSSLEPIAKFFNISVSQLIGEEPIQWLNGSESQLKELGIRRVPLLQWGNIIPWLDKKSSEHEHPMVLTESPVSDEAFAVIIKDSAMEPLFNIGTQAIFDPNKPYRDRHFVLVKLAQCDEPIFRQLILDAGDMFIKPLTPDLQHRIQMLTEQDLICGVLIEAKQRFDE